MKGLNVLIIGVGGLGKELVSELLERQFFVSTFVRSQEKLIAEIGDSVHGKLANSYVGDATDQEAVRKAATGKDVVFLGVGANLPIAKAVCAASKSAGVKKLIGVAGATNVLAEDGVTWDYVNWLKVWPPAEKAFQSHAPVIEEIRKSGIPFVILCPPLMKSKGSKSAAGVNIRINRPGLPFLSFEDAAWAMAEAAVKSDFDGHCITAAAKQ
jgi:putative NADH-flavin reductase